MESSLSQVRNNYLVLLQDSLAIKLSPLENSTDDNVDISNGPLQGVSLFQAFREVNLPCVWNQELLEAFQNLKYKGTILPSTILVKVEGKEEEEEDEEEYVLKFNNVLKNAWSRQIIKSPSGYKIHFMGEIEELVADPVSTSNFIPLSDSVCWAVHQLNHKGEEAFVDGIFGELCSTFENTTPPPKELLYQVLERLTKGNKVQLSKNGYFVYMSSEIAKPEEDKVDSGSDSEVYHKADNAPGSSSKFSLTGRNSSLRNSIRKYQKAGGCIPRKTFSPFSLLRTNKELPPIKSPSNSESTLNLSKESLVIDRRRKHKSFLKNMLTFRNTSKKSNPKEELKSKEMSTQTSNSLENMFGLLSITTPTSSLASSSPTNSNGTRGRDSDSGRFTEHSEETDRSFSKSVTTKENKTISPIATSPEPPITRPPSSLSSSSAYLFNNPYRRRYLNYHTSTPSSISSFSKPRTPTLLPKYPPRPFERKQIFQKIPPKPTTTYFQKLIETTNNSVKSESSHNSNVQVELLLPMGQLINKVLSDFDDAKKEEEEKKEESDEKIENKNVNDLFTFKSFLKTKTDNSLFNQEVEMTTQFTATATHSKKNFEKISSKPRVIIKGGDRESDI